MIKVAFAPSSPNKTMSVEENKKFLPYNIKGEILVDNKPVKLKTKPKVGVIIPTKSNLDLLFNCIDSFYEKDDYDNIVNSFYDNLLNL